MSMTFKNGNSTLKIETKGIDRAAAKIKGYGSINVKTPSCIKNYKELMAKLEKLNGDATKAVQKAVRDAKTAVPGYVATEVMQNYNVKKKEVNERLKSKGKGSMKVAGIEVDNIELLYEGNLMTPSSNSLGMSPRTREQLDTKKKKTITVQIKKGSKKKLPDGVFLGENGSGQDLPFQREGGNRLPIRTIRTVSVPQMITSSKVNEAVADKISEKAKTRLDHYVQQMLK